MLTFQKRENSLYIELLFQLALTCREVIMSYSIYGMKSNNVNVLSLALRSKLIIYIYYLLLSLFSVAFPSLFLLIMEDVIYIPLCNNFLYIHSGENLATSLVSPVFDANNYHFWSRTMVTTLSAENKVEFRDCMKMIHLPCLASLHKYGSIFGYVFCVCAHMIVCMDKVERRYGATSNLDIFRKTFTYSNFKWTLPLSSKETLFLNKHRVIWDELENFMPNLMCVCHNNFLHCSFNYCTYLIQ